MEDFAEFLGGTIIFFYSLAIVNFILKYGLKHYQKQLSRNKTFYQIYLKFVRFFVKYHRYFGILTIVAILSHFILMITLEDVSASGLVAASFMLTQVLLGAYGHFLRPKNKTWLWLHRFIALAIGIAIIVHIA